MSLRILDHEGDRPIAEYCSRKDVRIVMYDADPRILFVDLDGTLISSDMLVEAIIPLVARQSRSLFLIPGWLLRGRARFKRLLAQHVMPDIEQLPFRSDVLAFLQEQRDEGKILVMATASDQQWADSVANSLQIFDAVLASDGKLNLKGEQKLRAIEDYCRSRGTTAFGYIGDSHSDLPIWQKATDIYAVQPNSALLKTLTKTGRLRGVFGTRQTKGRAILRALRPHQWIKNVLVFVPIITSHRLNDWHACLAASVCFICFSASASAVYVINDVLDLQADRGHPSKRHRPFASGALPVSLSPLIALTLMGFAFGLSLVGLPLTFAAVLLIYLCVTTLYSSLLKRKALIDVFTLAGLYTLRVFAGGIAAEVLISEWLTAFSLFLFTSLAFVKRFAELRRLASQEKVGASRRGYITNDLALIESMGITSGYLSALVLALYIHSPEVSTLYTHHWALWLICPILLYWISRVWLQAKRGFLTEDPIVFAFTDWVSLAIGVMAAFLLLIAR